MKVNNKIFFKLCVIILASIRGSALISSQPKQIDYDILGVSQNANAGDVMRAFHELELKFRPGRNQRASNHYKEILEAYNTLISSLPEPTYYEILGVSRDANEKKISEAFDKLYQKFRPKINQRASEYLREIIEAYNALIDPVTRERYDKTESK